MEKFEKGRKVGKIILQSKNQRPPFGFYVKENTSSFNYYVYDTYEEAMEASRVLSLTGFPVSIILEPYEDRYGEWKMKRIARFSKGKCILDDKDLLHVKFYTDAGKCLNRKCETP